MSILTQIILAPFIGAIVALLIPRNFKPVIRAVALIATAVSMVLAVKIFFFDYVIVNNGREVSTLTHKIPWVASLGINYHVAVDGLNVGLILMGTIVAFAAVCISRNIKTYEKEFYILLLVMTGGILGAFASFDLFFFYFFHELALVPTFIMIGVWGRGENKNYATFQITLYLSIGALLALVGLIALYLQLPIGSRTFNIIELTKYFKAQPMTLAAQQFIFPLLLFGFGILVSLWPFHTWAPLGYGSAPAATAMLHAGVLKKFGLYGLIRIALPLMPDALQYPILPSGLFSHLPFSFFPTFAQNWLLSLGWMHVLAFLCLGNIVYCGFVAMRQRDLNMLIGNSSVAHMGFCFLGIASLSLIGVTGAVTVMIAHGLLAALTFALSGYLYQQTGTLDMDKMGGLLRQIPFIGAALVMAAIAGCGLPGFANFPGEALVLFGSWKVFPLVTAFAVWGALVIGAIYMLRAVRNILHGPLVATPSEPRDTVSLWRKLPYALLLASLLLFGFVPSLLTDKIKPSAQAVVEMATGQTKVKKAEKVSTPAALQAAVK